MNPTEIESHLKLVLIEWTVIIAAAWAFGRLARRVGQPLAVGEILAGILLGPSALGAVWPGDWPVLFPPETQQSLELLGKLGLILLLFQVGMEFDYGHLRSRSRTVTAVSILGIVAPFLIGLLIGPWLHREFAPNTPRFGFQLFLCIALSISALPIMGRILLEMKLERTAIGAMGISAAAIDDVTGWILLALASAWVTSASFGIKWAYQIVGVLLFVFLCKKSSGRGYGASGSERPKNQTTWACRPGTLFCCCWCCSPVAWSPTSLASSPSSARFYSACRCTRNSTW